MNLSTQDTLQNQGPIPPSPNPPIYQFSFLVSCTSRNTWILTHPLSLWPAKICQNTLAKFLYTCQHWRFSGHPVICLAPTACEVNVSAQLTNGGVAWHAATAYSSSTMLNVQDSEDFVSHKWRHSSKSFMNANLIPLHWLVGSQPLETCHAEILAYGWSSVTLIEAKKSCQLFIWTAYYMVRTWSVFLEIHLLPMICAVWTHWIHSKFFLLINTLTIIPMK